MDNTKKLKRHANPALKDEVCACPPDQRNCSGVIVAADLSQEWLLPWWWHCYKKHNSYPVAFIDLGMSFEMKDWCKAHGEHIPLRMLDFAIEKEEIDHKSTELWESTWGTFFWDCRNAWFKKPFACLRSPFQKTVWVDLDCEILGSLGPLFTYAKNIAMARGGCLPNPPYPIYNSGVIAFDKTSPLLKEWADRCITENAQFYGDQDVFSSLVHEKGAQIDELPPIYNWSRRNHQKDDIVIHHWHGPPGKAIIRRKIEDDLFP